MARYRRHNGVWKEVHEIYRRDAGVWKPVQTRYRKHADVWKEVYSSGPPIGSFMEGGYYMGKISYGGNTYMIILAPKALGQSPDYLDFGGYGVFAGATDFYDGPSNTSILVSHPTSFFPAEYCAGLSINGYSDWYLFAEEEARIVGNNKDRLPSGEELEGGMCWTSTEENETGATVLIPGEEYNYVAPKDWMMPVRAIRRVVV